MKRMMSFARPVPPDIKEMTDILLRRRVPGRVHHIELFLDAEMKKAVVERFALAQDLDRSDPLYETKRDAQVHSFLGYDMFRVGVARKTVFQTATIAAPDTTRVASQERSARDWQEEHAGPIQGWADFERYHWPQVSSIDFSPLEWLEKNLPRTWGASS